MAYTCANLESWGRSLSLHCAAGGQNTALLYNWSNVAMNNGILPPSPCVLQHKLIVIAQNRRLGWQPWFWTCSENVIETIKQTTESHTTSTELSPSEANSHSASQIFRLFWNPKVHNHVHKSPQLDHIPSQLNAVHTFTSYFLNIHLNIMIPSTTRSHEWPLVFRFLTTKYQTRGINGVNLLKGCKNLYQNVS
jgi:hypothetical protein